VKSRDFFCQFEIVAYFCNAVFSYL